ncbi:MAG: ABC transporter substrate-binding protein [Gammaproteobacteria bacterium]
MRHLIFIAGALVAGVSSFAQAQPLRVYGNMTTIELAPVLLAAKQLGPNVVTVTNGGIPNLYATKAADIADVATNAETQALRQSVDHPDLRTILTVSEGFYRIVARRSAGIHALQDLRDKKVATIATTSSGYYLHKMLGTVGMSIDNVTVVPLNPLSKMSAALANHEVDAVTIWEPEVQRALDAIGADAIEFQQVQQRTVYRELFNLNTTAANLANPAKRKQIVAFVRALVTASAEIRQRPQIVWPLVSQATGYDQALIEKVWPHEGYPGLLVPDLLDVITEEDTYIARERGRTPRTRSELAVLIDASVLRDALSP